MDSAQLVSATGITRNYGNLIAVDQIDFSLQQGEILGFLGPNGAGKSTTMSILTGNIAPHSGSIKICGIDLLDKPKQAKSLIGYLPENPPLYPQLNVIEYLRYCAQLHGISKKEITDAIDRAIQRCSLKDVRNRLIGSLSKGYQQRVGIAQAIIHSPRVLILDEPTVGLDPNQIIEIRKLITSLGKECGVIISTHILPEVEEICNRIVILNNGRLVFGSPLPISNKPDVAVSLAAPPPLDDLSRIFVDINVLQKSKHQFIFSPEFDYEFKTRFAQVAVKNGWGLEELRSIQPSLEGIFTNYVCSDINIESDSGAENTGHKSPDNHTNQNTAEGNDED
ncbi:MAG: ABC transporter ATP-binding protein [Gammaproteobacteria bacterium]|nr:MAG: ABC transporter ATP-binding protein [Gammaproteobacteria bacterium]